MIAEVVIAFAGVGAALLGAVTDTPFWWVVSAILAAVFLIILSGFYMLTPNEAAVLTFFGDYRGSDRGDGLRIANPLYASRKISLRIRNFSTTSSKVNDANGNPIHIAAVVVWQVVDTARASFGVDQFVDYVHVQSESAVRQMARAYPYESFEEDDRTTLIVRRHVLPADGRRRIRTDSDVQARIVLQHKSARIS